MNKKSLLIISLLIFNSCQSRTPKIELEYSEIGGFIEINLESYRDIFYQPINILTIFTLRDASYCSECLNVSFADVEQYAIDNHFDIYFYEFDTENSNFISDYKELVNIMKTNNDIGLSELTYQDGLPVFSGLPCLLYSYKGYIGYNVKTDFVKQLKDTIVVKNS